MFKAYQCGTHRLVAPEITLARTEALARVAGITRVANITGLDKLGVPVVAVYRPGSLSLVVSQGKGVSLSEARASGVMESIETWAAEQPPRKKVWASFEHLSESQKVLDPYSLPLSQTGGYAPTKKMHWVSGSSLIDGQEVWVPLALVTTNYTLPYDTSAEAFCMGTNGLASGNSREEGIVHALCELIERDADTLWRLQPAVSRNACRLDLDSIPHGYARELISRYHDAGLAVGVWNVTSDLDVPVFRCEIIEINNNGATPFFAVPSAGAGCHPNREIALIRAICEAAQSRLTVISGAREDLRPAFYASTSELRMRKVSELSQVPARNTKFEEIGECQNETFEKDIEWILEKLRSAGINETVVVDLEHTQESGVFAVRVLVPNLEMDSNHPDYRPAARALAARSSPL